MPVSVWQAAQAAKTAKITCIPQPVTPLHTPEHLYVSIDGAHAPIRDPQRPWQEVRVGVLFTTVPEPAEPRSTNVSIWPTSAR